MTQSDPTDNALAAIASILDHPPSSPAPEKVSLSPGPENVSLEDDPAPPPPVRTVGYSKVGPGPIAAIRFKWTVREENGNYYVDETIGNGSSPIVSGPMDEVAAIQFVDDREAEARQRFENLKQEMVGRGAAADLTRGNDGEI